MTDNHRKTVAHCFEHNIATRLAVTGKKEDVSSIIEFLHF